MYLENLWSISSKIYGFVFLENFGSDNMLRKIVLTIK